MFLSYPVFPAFEFNIVSKCTQTGKLFGAEVYRNKQLFCLKNIPNSVTPSIVYGVKTLNDLKEAKNFLGNSKMLLWAFPDTLEFDPNDYFHPPLERTHMWLEVDQYKDYDTKDYSPFIIRRCSTASEVLSAIMVKECSPPSYEYIDHFMESSRCYAAFLDKDIVASLLSYQDENGTLGLFRSYVQPSYRRIGLGSGLVRYAIHDSIQHPKDKRIPKRVEVAASAQAVSLLSKLEFLKDDRKHYAYFEKEIAL